MYIFLYLLFSEEARVTYIRSEEEKEDCQRRLNEARNQIQAQNEQHRLEISASKL